MFFIVGNIFIFLEVFYGTSVNQVWELGRKIVPVVRDDSSLFNSILCQVDDTSLTTKHLKNAVYYEASENPTKFIADSSSTDVATLYGDLEKLRERDRWSDSLRDVALEVLHNFLGLKIVLISDLKKPKCYPDDEEPITDECIVIVQHKDTAYYNATRKNDQNRKSAMLYKIKTRCKTNFFTA